MVVTDEEVLRTILIKRLIQTTMISLEEITLQSFCPAPFPVGFFGKWGSGKTAIVNMILHELQELQKDLREGKEKLKRHINNPYKMNWKLYSVLGAMSTLVMIIAVIWNALTDNSISYIISDTIKNLALGCVASTLIAMLIEYGNIKEKNEKAKHVYDAVYNDLKYQIMRYVESWSRLCSVAYIDEDYRKEKHTWIEWYDITKSKFAGCDDNRQAELMHFFNEQLTLSIDGIEKALKQIDSQRYILNINDIYDESLRSIFEDYNFEFYAAKLTLGRDYDKDDFWNSFDAIKQDLVNYIYNWVDIRYYNYCRFKPYNFYGDKTEIMRALQESEKSNK